MGVPRCTCCLFIATVACHIMVLVGNLSTAKMLNGLGKSASGWGSVASSITHALDNELTPAMHNVTQWLTTAVDVIDELEEGVDNLLTLTGSAVDSTMKSYAPTVNEETFKAKAHARVETVAKAAVKKIEPLTDKVMTALRPPLAQVEQWLGSFSPKIQDTLEEFGTVADRAQKLVDQVMTKVNSAGGMEEEMLWDTYHIFDPYDDGIQLKEFKQVANQYGISALQGKKSDQLLQKYDESGDGSIQISEYAQMVFDPSVPGMMTTILRTYSKKLNAVGSTLRGSHLRAEVADSLVDYLTIVCGKNLTKVGWITGKLVSGELPQEFTADVFYQLYMKQLDPNNLSPVDVGSLVMNYTVKANPKNTIAALDMLADTTFFATEGFDITVEDETVVQVIGWLSMSKDGEAALKSYAKIQPQGGENFAEAYNRVVLQREAKYTKLTGDAGGHYHSQAAQSLRDILLGGSSAASSSGDPDALQASSGAQPAKPATLRFAEELANNVSSSVKDFNEQTYAYSGTSSNPLDSTCNSINGMIKKTQSFLTLMNNIAGPGGQDFLKQQSMQFLSNTAQDIVLVSDELVNKGIQTVKCSAGQTDACNVGWQVDFPMKLSGGMTFITSNIKDLQGILPQVVKNLKLAKKEVGAVSGIISSISQILGLKAPPLLLKVSKMYKTVWVLYFIFFFLFSATMLFYAFWSNGWFGGPQADTASSSEPPQSFGERMGSCFRSCTACIGSCTSGHLCFWSLLLLAQVIILVLFLVSLLICILAGVQAFLGAGCSKIYLLGDNQVCTAVLGIFQIFLKTFGFFEPLEETCFHRELLTCKIIRDTTTHQAIVAIVGGLLASVLSFQMLIDSATKHERARCIRALQEEGLLRKGD